MISKVGILIKFCNAKVPSVFLINFYHCSTRAAIHRQSNSAFSGINCTRHRCYSLPVWPSFPENFSCKRVDSNNFTIDKRWPEFVEESLSSFSLGRLSLFTLRRSGLPAFTCLDLSSPTAFPGSYSRKHHFWRCYHHYMIFWKFSLMRNFLAPTDPRGVFHLSFTG